MISLPHFVLDACKYLGNMTTPLSMLFIGIAIYGVKLKNIKLSKDMVVHYFRTVYCCSCYCYGDNLFYPVANIDEKGLYYSSIAACNDADGGSGSNPIKPMLNMQRL